MIQAALNGATKQAQTMRVPLNSAIIKASTSVKTGADAVRDWFLSLQTHPKRYQFETHAGFAFTNGNFGEIGSQFQTYEKFYGQKLTLNFELTKIGAHNFNFRLKNTGLPFWGAFIIEPGEDQHCTLHLQVGGLNSWGQLLLQLPLLHTAVQKQIQGEVAHIKASIEALGPPR